MRLAGKLQPSVLRPLFMEARSAYKHFSAGQMHPATRKPSHVHSGDLGSPGHNRGEQVSVIRYRYMSIRKRLQGLPHGEGGAKTHTSVRAAESSMCSLPTNPPGSPRQIPHVHTMENRPRLSLGPKFGPPRAKHSAPLQWDFSEKERTCVWKRGMRAPLTQIVQQPLIIRLGTPPFG